MLRFQRKFNTESVSSEWRHCYRCNQRDADGDAVVRDATWARRPWQRTPAGDGRINMVLGLVSRVRVGGGDDGEWPTGGSRRHPSPYFCAALAFCLATGLWRAGDALLLRGDRLVPLRNAQHAVRSGISSDRWLFAPLTHLPSQASVPWSWQRWWLTFARKSALRAPRTSNSCTSSR
eukprot:COSAG02_NODE_2408_length_8928_cov_2.710953_1_plen_176_part_10